MLLRFLGGHPMEEQALREFLVDAPADLLACQVLRNLRMPAGDIDRAREDFRRLPLNQIAPPLLFAWGSRRALWVRGLSAYPRGP